MNEKLDLIINVLDEKLAEEIVYIDFEGRSSICDYFILCTAKNDRHSDSLITYLSEAIKGRFDIYHVDDDDSGWRIVDLGDIIVHIFLYDERDKYQLEKLWSDQKIVSM